MTILDRAILLATGLVALYLIWRFYQAYQSSPDKPNSFIYYIISLAVLFVAGVLLVIFTYAALDSPLVVIVSVFIPAGLSLGLVSAFYPKYERAYLAFALIGLIAIAVTRFTGPKALATIVLIIVHTVAGLLIFGVPIFAVSGKKAPTGFIWVTVGGALIGLGGIALAFLKTDRQLLFFSAEFVFTILAPLLLLMTLAFAWGFVKKLTA